jgi:hypothetical protein
MLQDNIASVYDVHVYDNENRYTAPKYDGKGITIYWVENHPCKICKSKHWFCRECALPKERRLK